jgi:hypothetical protein
MYHRGSRGEKRREEERRREKKRPVWCDLSRTR